MIVAQADPAMEKLTEMLVLPSAKVRENETLSQYREQLLKLGAYLRRAKEYLAEQDRPVGEEPSDPAENFADYLETSEKLELLLAMPTSNNTRSVLTANARLASQIDPQEARCIHACNLTRTLLGLNVLSIDVRLCAAARDHSADMAKLK